VFEGAVAEVERAGRERLNASVSRVLAVALRSRDAWIRQRTASALSELGGDAATVDGLIQALHEPALRDYACEALGKSHIRKGIPSLRRLLTDENELVRSEALTALARLSAPVPMSTVIATFKDPSPLVRISAVFFLRSLCAKGRLSKVRFAGLLRRHLLVENDALVLCDALESLHLLGDPDAFRSLLKLGSTAAPPVRWRVYATVAGLASCHNYRSVVRWLERRRRAERKSGIKRFIGTQIEATRDRLEGPAL
jgi:HEAT repeat protein